MTAVQVVLAVLSLLAVAAGGLYARYRVTPAAVWRRRVLAHAADLQARREALRQGVADTEAKVAALANEAFRRHTRTVPVERLADFPGIGPATVGKVKDAGYARLSDLERADFDAIPEVGANRAAALRDATASLLTDARSRFHAGGCPEAQEFRKQADALRAADRMAASARSGELAGVDDAVGELLDRLPLARAVTFVSYLLGRPVPGLTAEVMARPLPEGKPVPVQGGGKPGEPPVVAESGGSRPPLARTRAEPEGSRPPLAPNVAPPDLFRAELSGTASPSPPERPQLARLRAVVRLGMAVAKADGRVTQAERKVIRAYLDEAFGHDPAVARHLDPQMEQAAKANPDADAAVAAVKAAVPAADWPGLLRWAEQVADASGDRHPKEVEVLERVAAGLGVERATDVLAGGGRQPPVSDAGGLTPPARQERGQGADAPGSPTPAPPDPRAVLDIPPDAAIDAGLVRRKYRLLADRLDPAKAAAFGPEFAALADGKRAAARAAAEALLGPLGEPLDPPAAPPPPADLRHNPDLDDVFG